ncbi:MAG: DUF58 domain-containing protein [Patescibacteria group bacterium]|nr:DUF58 domain-containing protein [Patescibacteria group bacterium]
METAPSIQPTFDPTNVGTVSDYLKGRLPIHGTIMSGHVQGDISMRARGEGTDPRAVRDYAIGDNPRHIDWKATARQPLGKLQVQEFNRDIKPNFFVVTDVLQSRFQSMAGVQDYFSEQNLALGACIGLVQLASRNGLPASSLAINDDRTLRFGRPGRGQRHVVGQARQYADGISTNHQLETLLTAGPDTAIQRPRLVDVLEYAGQRLSHSVVAVVSDFRDAAPQDPQYGWQPALAALKARKNDIISVTVTNPGDFALPAARDRFATEQGVIYVPKGAAGREQRDQYAADAVAQTEAIRAALQSVKAAQIELSTADPRWVDSFKLQLQSKKA